ncbi:MAG: MATE family efflux transporter [Candidatus Riflebacteria bacterium]|nr:MATE family efflux transporter [Candidatus Riflebacteria bacterium]
MIQWTEKNQIYKQALILAIPMMIQNGITNAVGLVDNLMVGTLGTESITAVSIAVQLIFVYNLAVFGAISGPGIYCAQYFGQKNKEGFWNVFRLKFWICFIVLVVGLFIYNYFGTDLINLYLRGNDSGIDKSLTLRLNYDYLMIMLWSLLPFAVTQIYASSLRETGESIKPMVAGISSVLIDVVFNYLLIFGKFGFPCLGVEGAAIATVLARVVEMLFIIIWTYTAKVKIKYITGALRKITIPIWDMMVVIKKSIPIFLNEFLWAAGFVSTFQCYSLKGLDVVASMNIASTLQNLVIVIIISMGCSVGILIGQQLGASKFDEAKENSLRLTRFTGAIGVIVALMVISISGVFPKFFETTDSIKALGSNFIFINAIFLPLHGILNALYFTLRSGGKTFITFLFDSVFSWVFIVPAAYLLCKYVDLPIITIFVLVNGLEIIKIIIGYALIKKGVWISNLVEK